MSLDSGPAFHAEAVTPSNTATLDGCRALYVGTTGDVTIDTLSGTDITFPNVPAGAILPVAAWRVKTTTTASDIVALF